MQIEAQENKLGRNRGVIIPYYFSREANFKARKYKELSSVF
jgi:hypothetical protein